MIKEATPEHDLPLPPRGVQPRRHRPRLGSHVHHQAS
jgi:hypothetical protein